MATVIESLGIAEIWTEVRIEVRYKEGHQPPPIWTKEEKEELASTLGLHPRVYWIRPGHTAEDSQGRKIQYLYAESGAGGCE